MKKLNEYGKISVLNIILFIFVVVLLWILFTFALNQETANRYLSFITNTVTSEVELNPLDNGEESITKLTPRTSQNSDMVIDLDSSDIPQEAQNNINYNLFFYNQLDATGKSMYTTIMNNMAALKKGEKIKFDVKDQGAEKEFQSVWDAICLDRPDIFYIDTNKISFITETSKNLFGRVSYSYYMEPKNNGNYLISSWQNIDNVNSSVYEIENQVRKIISEASQQSSRYDKVKYIHDYIINNTEYNEQTNENNSNIYGALINKKAICEGYAESFKYLLDKIGVPCVLVYGDGINDSGQTEYHSWNEVLMDDGKWYAVDTTWDDPILIGKGKLPEANKYKYFLKGSSNFNPSHIKEGDVSGTGQNFSYPQISEIDY